MQKTIAHTFSRFFDIFESELLYDCFLFVFFSFHQILCWYDNIDNDNTMYALSQIRNLEYQHCFYLNRMHFNIPYAKSKNKLSRKIAKIEP